MKLLFKTVTLKIEPTREADAPPLQEAQYRLRV